MALATLVLLSLAFGLYAFAAWSEARFVCALDGEAAAGCGPATRSAWIFGLLTVATLSGGVLAWRKLDA